MSVCQSNCGVEWEPMDWKYGWRVMGGGRSAHDRRQAMTGSLPIVTSASSFDKPTYDTQKRTVRGGGREVIMSSTSTGRVDVI